MAVLRFTSSGLVSTPTSVQIRVTASLPGRLAAGAPTPSRDLSDDEVADTLHHFLVELRGPRTTPCDAAVLSGDALATRDGLAEVLREARRRQGLSRVTLHLGPGERAALRRSSLRHEVDDVAIVIHSQQDLADVAALGRSGLRVTAVVRLDEATLPRLEARCAALARLAPHRVALTWPLAGDLPPHSARVATALPAALEPLDAAGVAVAVKGLPPCTLGALAERTSRTRNRWYVDADHQGPDALLFFPDLLRFSKLDPCRFCSADARCDGAPTDWMRAGKVGPLRPLQQP